MATKIRTLALSSALLALSAGGALAGQAQHQPMPMAIEAAALPQSTALIDSYPATDKTPGIVAVVGRGDGPSTVLAAGKLAAEDGAAKVDADSLWRVYSMTKPITAMAAMILIEEGKIKLDQPVSDFIPAFKSMTVLVDPTKDLTARPATRPITIRNLLTHTAGLGYTIITTGPLLKEYERQGITPFTANAQIEAQMRLVRPKTLEEFANRVAGLPLIADPGTKWSYSIGLDVLGRVIEVASGMKFDAFLQKRIFTPLKMHSTYFTVPANDAKRLATGYTWIGANRVPLDPGATSVFLQPPSFPYGGAGLVMSAHDYDRFLHMLQDGGTLDGVRILKPATVALAMSNLLPEGVTYGGAVANTGGATGQSQGFGAGGSVYLVDIPGGPSKGTYGWGGAAGTIAWVDPVRHVRATVMVNYLPGEKWPLRKDFTKAFYADLAQ
ncbi:serine hydrolase [Sphingomonas sp. 28-63-12]|uniref:serine hydrolase domain-containing protein n=1 Tax=Sphingomonas sp. 28-63-12 TaxID=1970434 RepID=UPI000BD5B349|nr:MAG: serine hydrolase [Sphingomonas sp. 28-63-12]